MAYRHLALPYHGGVPDELPVVPVHDIALAPSLPPPWHPPVLPPPPRWVPPPLPPPSPPQYSGFPPESSQGLLPPPPLPPPLFPLPVGTPVGLQPSVPG